MPQMPGKRKASRQSSIIKQYIQSDGQAVEFIWSDDDIEFYIWLREYRPGALVFGVWTVDMTAEVSTDTSLQMTTSPARAPTWSD